MGTAGRICQTVKSVSLKMQMLLFLATVMPVTLNEKKKTPAKFV